MASDNSKRVIDLTNDDPVVIDLTADDSDDAIELTVIRTVTETERSGSAQPAPVPAAQTRATEEKIEIAGPISILPAEKSQPPFLSSVPKADRIARLDSRTRLAPQRKVPPESESRLARGISQRESQSPSSHPQSKPQPAVPILEHDPSSELGNELAVYVDGSYRPFGKGRRRGWGGVGIVYKKNGHWCGEAVALGLIADSFEAEMVVLLEGCRVARITALQGQSRLKIFSDCKGAIEPVTLKRRGDFPYDAICAERSRLKDQGIRSEFVWIKGHNGCFGNELADRLAKFASKMSESDRPRGGYPYGPISRIVPCSQREMGGIIREAMREIEKQNEIKQSQTREMQSAPRQRRRTISS